MLVDTVAVHGWVADGFEPVRREFAAALAAEQRPCAQLAVYHRGRLAVDLWAGESMTSDALTGVYSTVKGAAHLVVALLVQEGVLELDRAVAEYWPEFAAEGKDAVTLRDLLAHRAGAIGVDGGFTAEELADDDALAARLAPHRPFWRPGSGYGYHAFVIGALTGQVVRRATGQSLQQVYEQRIRAPYDLDLYLGLPAELEPRYIPVEPMLLTPQQEAEQAANAAEPDSLLAIAFNLNANPPTDLVTFANTRRARALGQASAGGIGNARGVARMYAAAIDPVDGREPLLTPKTLAQFGTLHTPGTDLVTGEVGHFNLGFEAVARRYPGLGADAIGHGGASGSQSFADPRSGIAYSYIRRRFIYRGGGGSPENEGLVAAVLGAARSA
jgi:CubicO group peptidase (beta-lactamase class C family)